MTASAPPPSLIYLCLENLRPGHAAHTHVMATTTGLRRLGWQVERFSPEQGAGSRSLAGRAGRYLKPLFKATVALRRAEMLYLRAHPAAWPLALAARLMGKPAVHEINGRTDDIAVTYRLPPFVLRALAFLQNWQFRRAAALIAVTPGLVTWGRSLTRGAVPVHLIVNGADGSVFRPGASAGPAIGGDYVLFFGGLAAAWHGISAMLDALRLPAWPRDLRLVIVGDGPRLDEIKALGDPRLLTPGFLRPEDLAGVAARALAILVPIGAQGQRDIGGVAPLKLFEGMASGRPVIVTDLPFQGDLVRELACGLVVPAERPDALAQAVQTLAADRAAADAMGKRGREAIETRFDWRFRVEETAVLLKDILEKDAKDRKSDPR